VFAVHPSIGSTMLLAVVTTNSSDIGGYDVFEKTEEMPK